NGAIGAGASPILAQTGTTNGLVAAAAKNDVYISNTGNLNLGYVGAKLNGVTVNGVSSATGTVNLQTSGSIPDGAGNTTQAANILAPTILLAAQGGAIGSTSDALDVGGPTAGSSTSLTASANGGITLTNVQLGSALNVVSVTSQTGDIVLTTLT